MRSRRKDDESTRAERVRDVSGAVNRFAEEHFSFNDTQAQTRPDEAQNVDEDQAQVHAQEQAQVQLQADKEVAAEEQAQEQAQAESDESKSSSVQSNETRAQDARNTRDMYSVSFTERKKGLGFKCEAGRCAIWSVSAAAKAHGVVAGDEIVRIDGTEVTASMSQKDITQLLVQAPLPCNVEFRHQAELVSADHDAATPKALEAPGGAKTDVQPSPSAEQRQGAGKARELQDSDTPKDAHARTDVASPLERPRAQEPAPAPAASLATMLNGSSTHGSDSLPQTPAPNAADVPNSEESETPASAPVVEAAPGPQPTTQEPSIESKQKARSEPSSQQESDSRRDSTPAPAPEAVVVASAIPPSQPSPVGKEPQGSGAASNPRHARTNTTGSVVELDDFDDTLSDFESETEGEASIDLRASAVGRAADAYEQRASQVDRTKSAVHGQGPSATRAIGTSNAAGERSGTGQATGLDQSVNSVSELIEDIDASHASLDSSTASIPTLPMGSPAKN